MTKRKRESMTSLLRAALSDAPSLRQVERETGVVRQSMMRFIRGESSLRLDLADILAEYFGIESRMKGRK